MKKIIYLNRFVIFLIVVKIVFIVGDIIILSMIEFGDQIISCEKNLVLGFYNKYIRELLSLLSLIGLYFVYRGLSSFIKNGFFNNDSSVEFRRGGLFILLSGTCYIILGIFLILKSNNIVLVDYITQHFLVLFIGFALYIVADIIVDGKILQQENDLTI